MDNKEEKKDIIDGARLRLRRMTVEDTPDVLMWRNKEFVVSHFIYRKKITREDHLNYIKSKIDTGLTEQFIMEVKEDGKLHGIGCVYLQNIDRENKKAEFGIFIGDEDALEQGYGTEAQKLILEYGREKLGLKTVTLKVLDDNERALRTYGRNGFSLLPGSVRMTACDGSELNILTMEKDMDGGL